jgi:hypothetical protein
MGGVVSAIEDAVGAAWDSVKTQVEAVWDVHAYLIETTFAIFNIVDEDVLIVEKFSTLIYDDNTIDVVHQAGVKAVMTMIGKGGSFFPYYAEQTLTTKAQIRTFYRLAENGYYIHGLPIMEIRGGDIDYDAIDLALDDALGFAATRLSIHVSYPDDEIYIQNELQASPYLYKPYDNTLTFGGDATWTISTYVYNSGPNNWTVNITHATLPDDTITVPGFVKPRMLRVTYHADADPASEWYYWLYDLSSEVYPDVNPEMTVLSELEMLPVAIIRRLGEDITVDKTSEEYLTTKKLVSALGMDVDQVLENAGANSYYTDIEDLYLNFSMNPTSTDEIVSKCLWYTFYAIVETESLFSTISEYTMTFEEQNVNNAAVWTNHIYSFAVVGTLPAPYVDYSHEIVGTSLVLKKNKGGGIYERIVINDLNGMTAIKKAGFHSMALNTLGDDNFAIPVSYFILNLLSPTEQMQLYQSMFRIDSYAAQIVHLEFYETPGFLTLFEFTMVAITLWSLGQATAPLQVVRQLLTQYLIMELVVYLAELTGNAEFAAVIGLVAAIALSNTTANPFDFSSAEGILNASTKFADNLTAAYEVEQQELREDLEELNTLAEQRLQEIKEATPEEGPITAEFLVGLQSVDTVVFPAIKAQYNFDLLYNYDRIIKDYYDINLTTGVT